MIKRCLTVITAFVVLTPCADAKPRPLKGSRPNIIVVMTDDQGMGDLSCMGNTVLKTPHIDHFYEMSTRFTEFHVSPSCAPTRSALLSGRHEFRNGVTHTIQQRELMALSTTTFPALFSKSGYQTGIFGKWHLGDDEAYRPSKRGFNEVFIHGAGGIGQRFPGGNADFPPNQVKEGRYFDNVILHNGTIVQTKGFCTDVFFQAALGWIRKQHESETPYFAYIAPNAPHGPPIAPDKYKNRFLDAGWDKGTSGRYGMIENIDDNFGLLMRKLTEWGALENTMVIFMTDNGQAGVGKTRATLNGKPQKIFSAGFKTGKGSPHEGGTHVPAFWYWKGVLGEGTDIGALTAHVDLFKTFCELAGADIPDGIQKLDGRSLLPLLSDPAAPWPDRKLFVHRGRWSTGGARKSKLSDFAVRTQRWRFVNNKELYDIPNDPYESKNVADQHPDVVETLRGAYDAWWEETLPLMVNEKRITPKAFPLEVLYKKQLKERGIPNWKAPGL